LKTIHLLLFYFGTSASRSHFPSSSGPSCSVPYCPPFLLGSTSSCSFSSLTDVTKVSAYILSRDCAMVCPHIPALSSGVCDHWHGSSVADDGVRHMEVGGAQLRAPLRFPVNSSTYTKLIA
jgi:hypothetical protein